ncbi:hypothetical protein [Pedobacter heparinus]|nr:hypothetical protein [Pedobacter heparinus]
MVPVSYTNGYDQANSTDVKYNIRLTTVIEFDGYDATWIMGSKHL